jgi:hypothetical protein
MSDVKRSATSIWSFVSTYPFAIPASILLLIAVILTVLDKIAGASLISGLFVVVSLFHYLPRMESFKAYGIEAKFAAVSAANTAAANGMVSTVTSMDEPIEILEAKKETLPPELASAVDKLKLTTTVAKKEAISLAQANSNFAEAFSNWPPSRFLGTPNVTRSPIDEG